VSIPLSFLVDEEDPREMRRMDLFSIAEVRCNMLPIEFEFSISICASTNRQAVKSLQGLPPPHNSGDDLLNPEGFRQADRAAVLSPSFTMHPIK
jgi:hypothetical protein